MAFARDLMADAQRQGRPFFLYYASHVSDRGPPTPEPRAARDPYLLLTPVSIPSTPTIPSSVGRAFRGAPAEGRLGTP